MMCCYLNVQFQGQRINITNGLKNVTATSDSNGIYRGAIQLTIVLVSSDVVTFLNLSEALTTNVEMLACARIACSKRCGRYWPPIDAKLVNRDPPPPTPVSLQWNHLLIKTPIHLHVNLISELYCCFTTPTDATLIFQIKSYIKATLFWYISLLQRKHRPLYLNTQSVPRCKHFSSRL